MRAKNPTIAGVLLGLIPVLALLPLTAVIPIVDSTVPPYFDLSQDWSYFLYWLTETGGFPGAVVVVLLASVLFVSARPIPIGKRIQELLVVLLIVAVLAGIGAKTNETVIKRSFALPRPNITALVEDGIFNPHVTSVEEFYSFYDSKEKRGQAIANAFDTATTNEDLHPLVLKHWSKETAYSFPSGHAYSAMLIATFFVGLALSFLTGWRMWFFYSLMIWALAICYSRPILRVHTPLDITAGGIMGAFVGLLGVLLARTVLQRISTRS